MQFTHLPATIETKNLAIILHGYGSNSANMLPIVTVMQKNLPHTSFVIPDAIFPFEDECEEEKGFQWFSLKDMSSKSILKGLEHAAPILEEFIVEQLLLHSLTTHELSILGFSQGGMLTLHTAFRMNPSPKNIICFSGALIAPELLHKELTHSIKSSKILITHGDSDTIIPLMEAKKAHDICKKHGIDSSLYIENNTEHYIGSESLAMAINLLR